MFVNDMFDQFFRQIYLVGSIMNDIVVEDVVPLICEKVEIYRIEIAVFCIVVILPPSREAVHYSGRCTNQKRKKITMDLQK